MVEIMGEPTCGWCRATLTKGKTGPAPKYCSDAHRLRAAEARKRAAEQTARHKERVVQVATEVAQEIGRD